MSGVPRTVPADGAPTPYRRIAGGIVAHNDEARIERSIRSLLSQRLPTATSWSQIWVVASGCTDRTVEVARTVQREDGRVRVVVEPERRGKSAAIQEVLRRAEGDALVLLNSDAIAEPGAVTALLARSDGRARPFAVMARPVAPQARADGWAATMHWMWELHHELHGEMLADGRGRHLSDELLLTSLPGPSDLEPGIINDGGYWAVWLQLHSGGCWYAPDARVSIDVARTPAQHLRQRRRIHVGNAQIRPRLGRSPMTMVGALLERPGPALAAIRRSVSRPGGFRHLATVAAYEALAQLLGFWDRLPPRRDHVLWSRISEPPASATAPGDGGRPVPTLSGPVERRVRLLTDVAREFGTRLPISQLVELLPSEAPGDIDAVGAYLESRPELGGGVDRSTPSEPEGRAEETERAERAARYWHEAEGVVRGPLGWLRRWVRCIGVTGSTAYGSPEPGDDIDFFVVARAGALPWWLAATYVSLRVWRARHPDLGVPRLCFNYLVDERRAPNEFGTGGGLLFAREALTARLLEGDSYYRGLLAAAPAIGQEFPRRYAARTREPGEIAASRPSFTTRALSALVYLPLAAYLQLAGLRRNRRARREGRPSDVFRTVTGFGLFAFQSQRFEELRRRYESPVPEAPPAVGGPSPTRVPWSR